MVKTYYIGDSTIEYGPHVFREYLEDIHPDEWVRVEEPSEDCEFLLFPGINIDTRLGHEYLGSKKEHISENKWNTIRSIRFGLTKRKSTNPLITNTLMGKIHEKADVYEHMVKYIPESIGD